MYRGMMLVSGTKGLFSEAKGGCYCDAAIAVENTVDKQWPPFYLQWHFLFAATFLCMFVSLGNTAVNDICLDPDFLSTGGQSSHS